MVSQWFSFPRGDTEERVKGTIPKHVELATVREFRGLWNRNVPRPTSTRFFHFYVTSSYFSRGYGNVDMISLFWGAGVCTNPGCEMLSANGIQSVASGGRAPAH